MHHQVDLQYQRLRHGCSPLEVEGAGEAKGELSAEVVPEIVGQVMV